jgi:hypothetical protein
LASIISVFVGFVHICALAEFCALRLHSFLCGLEFLPRLKKPPNTAPEPTGIGRFFFIRFGFHKFVCHTLPVAQLFSLGGLRLSHLYE